MLRLMGVSVPSLHRESTDSLILGANLQPEKHAQRGSDQYAGYITHKS